MFILAGSAAPAQTYNETIPAGAGTLSYTVTDTRVGCTIPLVGKATTPGGPLTPPPGGNSYYWIASFNSFSYTASGVTTPLSGSVTAIDSGGRVGTCPAPSYPTVMLTGGSVEIMFTPSGLTGGTAYLAAVAYPDYQVISIIYAPPGNHSSNGYTDATTDGTTTSITQSFTSGSTSTFTMGFSFLGIGANASMSFGTSQTNGNSSAFTETMTDSTGWANGSSGGSNQINHLNDLFLIWINPAIEIVSTGSKTWLYSVGTQLQTAGDPNPGSPEVQDVVEVFASAMSANASGATTVPLEALIPQVVDGQTLPGLAVICANHSYYPNSCTQANQCGCVPSDFKTILAQDPLLNYTSTENPLNADTSGVTACTCPTASDECRYVPVPTASGSCVQETELLCGLQTAGGNDCVNTFTQTDSNTTTQTLSESDSYTVGYSWGVSAFGSGMSSATQFTYTESESTGAINGSANSMTVTLSSGTLDCYQEIPIFEDTVYHTFVFQQPAGNRSCP